MHIKLPYFLWQGPSPIDSGSFLVTFGLFKLSSAICCTGYCLLYSTGTVCQGWVWNVTFPCCVNFSLLPAVMLELLPVLSTHLRNFCLRLMSYSACQLVLCAHDVKILPSCFSPSCIFPASMCSAKLLFKLGSIFKLQIFGFVTKKMLHNYNSNHWIRRSIS